MEYVSGKFAELDNMCINQNFQKCGIGARLYAEFVKWCKTNGVDYIKVTASTKNKNAIAFYNRMGFGDYNTTLIKTVD